MVILTIEEKMDIRDDSFKKVLVYEEMAGGFIDTIRHICLIIFFILAMYYINQKNFKYQVLLLLIFILKQYLYPFIL